MVYCNFPFVLGTITKISYKLCHINVISISIIKFQDNGTMCISFKCKLKWIPVAQVGRTFK